MGAKVLYCTMIWLQRPHSLQRYQVCLLLHVSGRSGNIMGFSPQEESNNDHFPSPFLKRVHTFMIHSPSHLKIDLVLNGNIPFDNPALFRRYSQRRLNIQRKVVEHFISIQF